jgi:predicted NBD/HSP70 family sugar kinase
MSPPPRKNAVAPRVLHALLAAGFASPTFAELAVTAGVAARSVTSLVGQLEGDRVLVRNPLRFGPGAGLALGLSIGSENIRGALVDANGKVWHGRAAVEDPAQLRAAPPALLRRLADVAAEVLAAGLADRDLVEPDGTLRLLGVNVAWPAPVDRTGRAHGYALDHPGWAGQRLGVLVSRALADPFDDDKSVWEINDANAAIMAVAFDLTRARVGDPEGTESRIAMAVRLGGAVGAGTMEVTPHRHDRLSFIDSKLIVGTNGFAGELGHLPVSRSIVADINDRRPERLVAIKTDWRCSCPESGHLEALASARALLTRLQLSGYSVDAAKPVGSQVAALLARNDAALDRALQDVGRLVGRALASPILMLDPASITLVGYLARDEVVAGIRREEWAWSTGVTNSVNIDRLEGDDNSFAEARGAALALIRSRLYRRLENLTDLAWRAHAATAYSEMHLASLRAMHSAG